MRAAPVSITSKISETRWMAATEGCQFAVSKGGNSGRMGRFRLGEVLEKSDV